MPAGTSPETRVLLSKGNLRTPGMSAFTVGMWATLLVIAQLVPTRLQGLQGLEVLEVLKALVLVLLHLLLLLLLILRVLLFVSEDCSQT